MPGVNYYWKSPPGGSYIWDNGNLNGYWYLNSARTTSAPLTTTGGPGNGDIVWFDSASSTGSYVVTRTSTRSIYELHLYNPLNGTLFFTGTSTITFYLDATTYRQAFLDVGNINWTHTGNFLDSANSNFGPVTLNIYSEVTFTNNFNALYSVTLLNNLFTTGYIRVSVAGGLLNLGYSDITCSSMALASSVTINSGYYAGEGRNVIYVTGNSGTVFDVRGFTVDSSISTPETLVNIDVVFTSAATSGTRSIISQFSSITDLETNLNKLALFNLIFTSGSGTISLTGGGSADPFSCNDLIFTGYQNNPGLGSGFTGIITLHSFGMRIYGNLYLNSGIRGITGSNSYFGFYSNPYKDENNYILSNNLIIPREVRFQIDDQSNAGLGWTFLDNFKTVEDIFFDSGSLDLNGKTISSRYFFHSQSGDFITSCDIVASTPSIIEITVSNSGGITEAFQIYPDNLDLSRATPNVTVLCSGNATAPRPLNFGVTGNLTTVDQYFNVAVSNGSGSVSIEPNNTVIGSLDLRGSFTGEITGPTTKTFLTICGDVYLGNSNNRSYTTANSTYTWNLYPNNALTNLVSLFSSNNKTVTWPLQLTGFGTLKFVDNFTYTTTLPFNTYNGTINVNRVTTNINSAAMTPVGAISIINGVFTCTSFTHAGGSLTLDDGGGLDVRNDFIFPFGIVNTLNGTVLRCVSFTYSGNTTGSINFDSGYINVTGSGVPTTVWSTPSNSTLTITDTGGGVILSNTGFTRRTINQGTSDIESKSINFFITTGTGEVIFQGGSPSPVVSPIKSLTFTNFGGSCVQTSPIIKLYGNLAISSSMVYQPTNTYFSASTGNKTIATAGNGSLDKNFIIDSTASYRLLDNVNGTSKWTLNRGTLDLNRKTLSVQKFTSTSSTNRTLNMTSSTILMTSNVVDTSAIWTVTNTLVIQSNTGSNIYFVGNDIGVPGNNIFNGGGNSYNLVGIKDNGYAGGININGSNRFVTLQQDIYTATTCTFQSGTITTVTNFNISGKDANNLATIRSSTPGTQFTLSKSSGIVSVQFTRVQDSNATGGARWFALKKRGNIDG